MMTVSEQMTLENMVERYDGPGYQVITLGRRTEVHPAPRDFPKRIREWLTDQGFTREGDKHRCYYWRVTEAEEHSCAG